MANLQAGHQIGRLHQIQLADLVDNLRDLGIGRRRSSLSLGGLASPGGCTLEVCGGRETQGRTDEGPAAPGSGGN